MCRDRRLSSTSGTGDIKCPYFVAHNDIEIMCEGLIDGCRSCMRFRETGKKAFHQEMYCEGEYKRCEMFLSIEHWKWPEE